MVNSIVKVYTTYKCFTYVILRIMFFRAVFVPNRRAYQVQDAFL